MTSLCAGLAIFGLCLPVPGHPVDSVKAAGWVNQSEEKDTWMSVRMLASNSYQLGALVEGDLKRVMSVWLRESRSSDREKPDSPLRRALDQACGGAKEVKPCRFQGYSFWRIECGGGFLLYSTELNPDRHQRQEDCKRFGALLK